MITGTFRGWAKTSLIEYPGKVSTVVFTGGCNLRCPFCYNGELVLCPATLPAYPASDVLAWLEGRRRLVRALVVSGGEPTIHPWLEGFCRELRGRGFSVGIATNGSYPERLEPLLTERLVDYVAMDVKTVLEPAAYARATGTGDPGLAARVRRSVELVMRSSLDYELRCTVVPELHTPEALLSLAAQLGGARRLVFQEFRPEAALEPSYRRLAPYPAAELEKLRELAATFVRECSIRYSAAPPSPRASAALEAARSETRGGSTQGHLQADIRYSGRQAW